jgi:hypothetical protein
MTVRIPSASLARVLVAAAFAVSTAAACSRPARPPVPTMDSPTDVAATRYCILDNGSGEFMVEPAVNCIDDNASALVARAVVPNAGKSRIHVIDLDLRIPKFIDFDSGSPGNTGIAVGDGPNVVAVNELMPGIALVGSMRDTELGAVDIVTGQAIGRPLRLQHSLRRLRPVPGRPLFVGIERLSPTLRLFRMEISCGGVPMVHGLSCAMDASLSEVLAIPLPAAPTSVAVNSAGRVWVSVDDSHRIPVYDLLLDEAGIPGCTSNCMVDELAVFEPCWDGLDNDGDGLVDGDDPQCYGTNGDEAVQDDAQACADGIDNDGDGAVDADDPDCLGPFGNSEDATAPIADCADGFDNDLDGLTDDEDPACANGEFEFERQVALDDTLAATIPACSDGLDNDSDGFADWPDDTDCYSANSTSERLLTELSVADLVLTEEQDLVLALLGRLANVLIFNAETGERLAPNEEPGGYDSIGIPVVNGQGLNLVTYTFDLATETLADGNRLFVRDRVAHATLAQGYIDPLFLDRRYVIEDADGNVVSETTEERFSRYDFNRNPASVRVASCDFPADAREILDNLSIGCTDPEFPQPQVVNADAFGDSEPSGDYITDPAGAYLVLPRMVTQEVNDERTGLQDLEVPDDYVITNDVFELTWEGVLPASDRSDAIVTEGGEWVEILGLDPCSRGRDACSVGLDLSACTEARTLCEEGVDLCAEGYDICRLCPQACERSIDFCEVGVVPGDRLIFDQRSARVSDPACTPFVTVISGTPTFTSVTAEYEVVSVQPDRLRIAVVPDPEGDAAVDYLPPASCTTEPVPIEIRGSDSWVWTGRSTGHYSPFVASGGQCVIDPELAAFTGRPQIDKAWESPERYTINIASGTAALIRDFRLIFDVRSGFANAQNIAGFLLLGPSNSGAAHVQGRRGHRLVFTDDAQNFSWVYSGSNFVSITGPLP